MMDAVTRLVVYAFAGFVGAFAVTAGVGLVVIFLLHWLGSLRPPMPSLSGSVA